MDLQILLTSVVGITCAISGAVFARQRGRSQAGWFLGGLLLGPLGVFILLLLPRLPRVRPASMSSAGEGTNVRLVFRILAVLYALVVMTVSSLPNIHVPNLGITWSDKVAHFAQYAVFAFLVAGGWGRRALNRLLAENWRAAGFLIAFAALDEIHQLWIPRREASFWDWSADSLGIVLGFTVGLYLLHRRRRPTSP